MLTGFTRLSASLLLTSVLVPCSFIFISVGLLNHQVLLNLILKGGESTPPPTTCILSVKQSLFNHHPQPFVGYRAWERIDLQIPNVIYVLCEEGLVRHQAHTHCLSTRDRSLLLFCSSETICHTTASETLTHQAPTANQATVIT